MKKTLIMNNIVKNSNFMEITFVVEETSAVATDHIITSIGLKITMAKGHKATTVITKAQTV